MPLGSNATFSATASGTAPLFYQWKFNGTNLAGATNATLIRSNVQPSHAGNYLLVATNTAGAATSLVAALTVTVSDTDGDGLPDWWESPMASTGTTPPTPISITTATA